MSENVGHSSYPILFVNGLKYFTFPAIPGVGRKLIDNLLCGAKAAPHALFRLSVIETIAYGKCCYALNASQHGEHPCQVHQKILIAAYDENDAALTSRRQRLRG